MIVPACKNGFTHEENLRFYLDFCSLIRTFAAKKYTGKEMSYNR